MVIAWIILAAMQGAILWYALNGVLNRHKAEIRTMVVSCNTLWQNQDGGWKRVEKVWEHKDGEWVVMRDFCK